MQRNCNSSGERWVPEPEVCVEFNIAPMTAWRWDHNAKMIAMGWPPYIKINRRKFRSRTALDAFKARLVAAAISERQKLTAAI